MMFCLLRLNLVRAIKGPQSQRWRHLSGSRSCRHMVEPATRNRTHVESAIEPQKLLLLMLLLLRIISSKHLLLLSRSHSRGKLLSFQDLMMLLWVVVRLRVANRHLMRRQVVVRVSRRRIRVSRVQLRNPSSRWQNGRRVLQSLRSDIRCKLLLGIVELALDLPKSVLEYRDETHTTVDWVPEPSLGFISQRLDRVVSLRCAELVENLGDIACAKNPVDVKKPLRIIRWEVGCEHAFLRAFSPQKLARSARRIR